MKGCGAGPCPPSSSCGERCDGAALGLAADARPTDRRTVGQHSRRAAGPGRRFCAAEATTLRAPLQRSQAAGLPRTHVRVSGTTDRGEASAGPRGLRGFSELAACETLGMPAKRSFLAVRAAGSLNEPLEPLIAKLNECSAPDGDSFVPTGALKKI